MRSLSRLEHLLADRRGRRVVLVSHCLLNQNVRYLGGAQQASGDREAVDAYLAQGLAIHQLPCPEQRAWGGAAKRWTLPAYGAGGTVRAPLVRGLLPVFVAYTRLRYAALARTVGRWVADYRRSGVEVVEVVGIAGSPSCGVRTTLDLAGAVDTLSRCPWAQLDLRTIDKDVIGAHLTPGQGWFMRALQRRLAAQGEAVRFAEVEYPSSARTAEETRDSSAPSTARRSLTSEAGHSPGGVRR